MNRNTWLCGAALSVLTVTVPLATDAATYCVSTSTELQQALTAAAASTPDDEIRLRTGIYTAQQTFIYQSQNNGWMFLSGGWVTADGNNCGQQVGNAATTILDGAGQRQILSIAFIPPAPPASGPRLGVYNLTLANGVGQGFQRGGGLNMSSTSDTYVEYWLDNLIVNNNSGHFAGGVELYAQRGLMRVVNSLFRDNSAPTTAFAHLATTIVSTAPGVTPAVLIANSTFADGTCPGNGGRGCGIGASLGGGVRMDVINTLFWQNAISDVNAESLVGSGTVFYDRSRVPVTSGTLSPTITEPLLGNPLFIAPAGDDYRLSDASPFINQGRAMLPIYSYLGYDVTGNLRTRFSAIDPGAYENQTWDFLFANGFQ